MNEISIIIPVYNAQSSIKSLVEEIRKNYSSETCEIVLVNDGSTDKTDEICKSLFESNSNLVYVRLRRNFGEHNAVMCGLNHCTGNYAAIIDDDFQNPPSEIQKLYEKAVSGYDVVYSYYKIKKHHLWRNLVSRLSNNVSNLLMNKPHDLYLSSFKIINREVINEIIKYKGPFPYIDGLVLRCTQHIASVEVRHDERIAGRSNYTLKRLFSLFMNMFLNFSVRPLRVFTISGFLIFISGLLLSAWFIYIKLTKGDMPGWTSIVIFILLLSGFQIIFLGLIGEYLGKQYLDQNNTPQWVQKEVIRK